MTRVILGLLLVIGCGTQEASSADPAPVIEAQSESAPRAEEEPAGDLSDGTPAEDPVETPARDEASGESAAEEDAPEGDAPDEAASDEARVEDGAEELPSAEEPSSEEAARVVEEATAAAAAAETGSTYCESAHGGLVAMVARVAESYPDRTLAAPERIAFLEICESLPEEVQRCLLPSHATAHQSECAAASERLSADDARQLESVLRPETH